MKQERPINYMDLVSERHEYLFKMPAALESFVQARLINPADLIMLRLIYNISVTVFPSAIILYVMKDPPVILGVLYVVMILVFYFQRFILTLHFASHKHLFKSKTFDYYLQYVVCPFFGLPGGAYRSHHVVMHHVENNVFPYDVSSTMQYQRDSLYHFLCYWMRYMIAIWVQLPYYAYLRKRYTLMAHTLFWITIYLVGVTVLYQLRPTATTWVFIVPYILSSLLLMLGNWCQHIFIDPSRYSDSYALTYNLINTYMNQLTYNDGYHIVHHLYSQLHWSELPKYFNEHVENFVKHDSLTFEGMEYLQIGFYVFFGQYEKLVKHYVHLGTPETKKSDKELIQRFKDWLVPVQPKEE